MRRNVCDDSLRVGFYPGADHSHVGFVREFLRYSIYWYSPSLGYIYTHDTGVHPRAMGKKAKGAAGKAKTVTVQTGLTDVNLLPLRA